MYGNFVNSELIFFKISEQMHTEIDFSIGKSESKGKEQNLMYVQKNPPNPNWIRKSFELIFGPWDQHTKRITNRESAIERRLMNTGTIGSKSRVRNDRNGIDEQ